MIPLSTRLRPKSLDEFVGQHHFLYKGSLLYNAIKQGKLISAIFHGPSGTGKTTLARIIAGILDSQFVEINASETGITELRKYLKKAQDDFFGITKKTTFIYVDEFHRWNKSQQDALLKALEEGSIAFIGSTTENPYFSINNAILSRVGNIFQFKPLDDDSLNELVQKAIKYVNKMNKERDFHIDEGARRLLCERANGDGRVLLDTLGYILENMPSEKQEIDVAIVGEAIQRPIGFFTKGDDRYDLLSALQKSVRGSDPDASVYYLARLIDGGADINMIGRRLLVMATEDVSLAYPQAISVVNACVDGANKVGYPEAGILLAQATILMASSPKSNSSISAYYKAMAIVRKHGNLPVPDHLRDSHYAGAKKMGYGKEYKYPHDFDGAFVDQDYLPDKLLQLGEKLYLPNDRGMEKSLKKYLDELEKLKIKKK